MSPTEKITLTRRVMIRLLGIMAMVPLAGVWQALVRRTYARKAHETVVLEVREIAQGIGVADGFYTYRQGDTITIRTLKCTHLGCHLRVTPEGRLSCPCHGSVFDPQTGEALQGPASLPLKVIHYEVTDEDQMVFSKS